MTTFFYYSPLPPSYDHLANTIMYGEEILELEDVRQMLQNNKMTKKMDSIEEASGLFVNGKKRSNKDSSVSSGKVCFFCKKSGHFKKNCFKYLEMLMNKGVKVLIGLVKSQEKPESLRK